MAANPAGQLIRSVTPLQGKCLRLELCTGSVLELNMATRLETVRFCPLRCVAMKIIATEDMDFIRIIRRLREESSLTQTEVADVLKTSQTMYARYERGANEMPIHHLLTLSEFYNVSSDYLLGLSDTP